MQFANILAEMELMNGGDGAMPVLSPIPDNQWLVDENDIPIIEFAEDTVENYMQLFIVQMFISRNHDAKSGGMLSSMMKPVSVGWKTQAEQLAGHYLKREVETR